jgi:hypothetical protein
MSQPMSCKKLGFGLLAGALMSMLGLAQSVEAEEKPQLERVASIELKGATGALDHLFVDGKESRLFLANQTNDSLDVVDVKGNKLLKQVPGQKQMHGVVYDSGLNRIFVGNGDETCNVLDGRDYTLLKSLPVKSADSVRYDPRTNHVFVTSGNNLAVIDAKTLDLLPLIELPGNTHGLQVATKQPRLYVNTGPASEVTVVDTDKNKVVANYKLGADDKGIAPLALDEGNKRIFVGLRAKPRLAVLDLDSGKEVASVPIPEGADDMFYDAKAKRIYISCGSGFVAVIRQVDADRYESVADVPTVKGAKTSCYDPGTQRLYVAVPRQAGKEGPEIWVYQAKR